METNNRRDFLKKAALAGASALVAPSLFAAEGEGRGGLSPINKAGDLESKLIVPKNNGFIRIGVRKNGIWIFST